LLHPFPKSARQTLEGWGYVVRIEMDLQEAEALCVREGLLEGLFKVFLGVYVKTPARIEDLGDAAVLPGIDD